ncbi:hypothetical protein RHMOL_Rhmol13G0303900 [Rhododendron molle]|uniref:Uncharacterized protein n=1 Tax=Rhododendron molle TaxID=49168 RepID=A0ACC0LDH6_RHOML|nr:hypothetical protein RHMOL_Rhmol13G0303900 [Rhododendron molle]
MKATPCLDGGEEGRFVSRTDLESRSHSNPPKFGVWFDFWEAGEDYCSGFKSPSWWICEDQTNKERERDTDEEREWRERERYWSDRSKRLSERGREMIGERDDRWPEAAAFLLLLLLLRFCLSVTLSLSHQIGESGKRR